MAKGSELCTQGQHVVQWPREWGRQADSCGQMAGGVPTHRRADGLNGRVAERASRVQHSRLDVRETITANPQALRRRHSPTCTKRLHYVLSVDRKSPNTLITTAPRNENHQYHHRSFLKHKHQQASCSRNEPFNK
jgi:hypothetical protein